MRRWYRLVNEPWIYGPKWWRARRVSKATAARLHADHVAWAQELNRRVP